MSNPYAPPKASIEPAAARVFSAALLLRHLGRNIICGTSLLALLSRIGGSAAFWSALALNAGAAAFLVYVFDFRGAETSDWMAMLLFIAPLGLNILALLLLRLKRR